MPVLPGHLNYPLNPVDNAMLAVHESLRQRGYCGLSVMLIADLEGPVDPAALSAAVRRLGREYPALSAHVRFSPIMRRAYWHIAADADLEAAVEYRHEAVDPAADDPDGPLRRTLDEPVDPRRGPQLCLVHVQTGPRSHRLGLRWAHPLMDMEGGHQLFRQLHAILSDMPLTLGSDPRARLPRPYRRGFPRTPLRVWQGRLRHAYYDFFAQPRIVARRDDAPQTCNFQLRRYDADFRRRFEECAKRRAAPGPLLYTRALMVAVARTYLRMARERGRRREHYLFSHALPLPRTGPRPGVHGNHVVVPWIVLRETDLHDWNAADAAALRQFRDYVDGPQVEAQWEMYRASQRWAFPLVRLLAAHRIPRGAAGCTSYRFGDDTRRFGDAAVTNLAGAGPMNCHPGWLIGHTTFGDTMSLSITHFEDYFDAANVAQFLDWLEVEITSCEQT